MIYIESMSSAQESNSRRASLPSAWLKKPVNKRKSTAPSQVQITETKPRRQAPIFLFDGDYWRANAPLALNQMAINISGQQNQTRKKKRNGLPPLHPGGPIMVKIPGRRGFTRRKSDSSGKLMNGIAFRKQQEH
jgi:hypothetical protein